MQQDHTEVEKIKTLTDLSQLVEARSSSNREFRRAVGTLAADLGYVAEELRRDPQSWRMNRAFFAVHVPSLTAVVSVLDDLDQMTSFTDEEAHQVHASLNRASMLAKDARKRIEQSKLTKTKVELEVLAEYSPPPAKEYMKSSRFTRAIDNVTSTSESLWGGVKASASGASGLVGNLQDGVSGAVNRAASVPVLVRNIQKTLSGSLSDNVSKPISMRVKASGRALENGVGAGVGLGVVVGVLCPPLLPLKAGGAVYAAMRTWRKEMESAQALNDAERQSRVAELKAERTAALKQLTHGAPALQMETDDISLTVDVETGEADAVVLSGKHAGQSWSSLTADEKLDVGVSLLEGASHILQILDIAFD